MKTRRLYYEDCHLRQFAANVIACTQTDKGFLIELDATAFYPEGGGQPCDLGTLADANVLDVREEGETVLHLCDNPLPIGVSVTGIINWHRRFDFMQQHTGEHIVSGILHKMFGCHNVGFHIGADVVTIDFDVLIPPEVLSEVEKQANQAIYNNLPVRCWYPSPEDLPNVTYRTKRELPWPVRIVQIPEYDTCACCGVHTALTGEVGIIKLLSCVKFHQGVRMEMVCGSRALDLLSKVYEQNKLVCKAFSAKLLETGAAAQRMNESLAAEKFRATALEKQLLDIIAAGYAGQKDVTHFASGLAPATVRELAERICNLCDGTVSVFSGDDKTGYTLCIASKAGLAQELGRSLCQQLGGKGGGKPGFFQGSIPGSKEQILKILQP